MDNIANISVLPLWIIVLINLAITLALVRRLTELLNLAKTNQRPELIPVGEKAPELQVMDLAGNPIHKGSSKGTKTAIVFVSPTCQPCRDAMPKLRDAHIRAFNNDVEMYLVSTTDLEITKSFSSELNIDVPLYAISPNGSVKNDFKVVATPTYYLLDTNWHVLSAGNLDATWDAIVRSWKLPVTANASA
jgi:peroxiredoxin